MLPLYPKGMWNLLFLIFIVVSAGYFEINYRFVLYCTRVVGKCMTLKQVDVNNQNSTAKKKVVLNEPPIKRRKRYEKGSVWLAPVGP
jgi:hypothetical protein